MAIGKGIAEYMMWAHDTPKANGISTVYAVVLALAPFAVTIFILATGMFYWLNNRINK